MLKLNGQDFTVGRSKFLDRLELHPEATAKIYVKIRLNGVNATLFAQLDTGAPWSILQPEVADAIGILGNTGESITLSFRDGTISGHLVRLPVTILADEGESIIVDATVFVSPQWPQGNFIGYGGLLERIRFALDAQFNHFYFGPAG